MSDATAAEKSAVRVTSTAYDQALLGVTAERMADGLRVLLLNETRTIRTGKDLTARILGKPWAHVAVTAYVA